ncbi:MAG TPA: helix-turn-helix domain-containing protein, partial [Pyrinomonadaceae bacterium]
LLRVGVLTGWLGSRNQTADAQETAKNLITQSTSVFESIRQTKKVTEARTELAVCYWHEGAYNEARIIVKDLLEHFDTDDEERAKALLVWANVESSAGYYSEALRLLMNEALLFKKIDNHLVKGSYHRTLALVLLNLSAYEKLEDYPDRALIEYFVASYHFEQAGHTSYRAIVESELGSLLFKLRRFKEAQEHLDHSRRLFSNLKDRHSVANLDQTRAQALIAEGRCAEAERVAVAAIRTLEKEGQQALLAKALTTQGQALARLGRHALARLTFEQAIETAESAGAQEAAGEAALTMFEELNGSLSADELQAAYERAGEHLVQSQEREVLCRLLWAANKVLAAVREINQQAQPGAPVQHLLDSDAVFGKGKRHSEALLISQALKEAGGSITQAARLLGITHQRLAYLLQTRHKSLLPARTPARTRRKRIIKETPALRASH